MLEETGVNESVEVSPTETDVTSGEEEVVESPSTEAGLEQEESDNDAPEQPDYTKQVEGFKSAALAERERRQAAEQKARELQMHLERMNATKQQELPQYADDDYLTFKEVKQYVERAIGERTQSTKQTLISVSERIARMNHADYDDVINQFTTEIVRQNPSLIDYIGNSQDPAETAYLLGKTHPNYQQTFETKAATKVAKKIQQNSAKVTTLSDVGASPKSAMNDIKRIEQMSDDELELEIAKAKGL